MNPSTVNIIMIILFVLVLVAVLLMILPSAESIAKAEEKKKAADDKAAAEKKAATDKAATDKAEYFYLNILQHHDASAAASAHNAAQSVKKSSNWFSKLKNLGGNVIKAAKKIGIAKYVTDKVTSKFSGNNKIDNTDDQQLNKLSDGGDSGDGDSGDGDSDDGDDSDDGGNDDEDFYY